MAQFEIKKANLNDLSQLKEIGTATFYETFKDDNAEEDMKKYLEESFSNERLQGELENPNAQFYFAIIENKVVGYLKVNIGDAQSDLKDGDGLEIERIYVLKEFHGKKVGQVLYEKAMQIATDTQVPYVWLGVWEHNLRAIRFYEKNGFEAFDTHIFVLGEDVQTDILMKKVLGV